MTEHTESDTVERRRARHAYGEIRDTRNPKLSARVQGLPIAVRSQGLTVAVATLLRENRAESRELARILADWLLGNAGIASQPVKAPDGRNLLDHAVTCGRSEYLALQAEALVYLDHLKRLSSAMEKSS